MRFMRFSLALLALLIGLVFAMPLQAQMRNAGSAEEVKRGRRLKPTGVSGVAPPDAANYQVTQTTGAITQGTAQVTGFNCGITPQGDDCMATVALPFSFKLYDLEFSQVNVSTNGNLQFVSNNADYGQNDVCFPLPQFSYAILPHWGDLTVGGANEGVFTSVSGTAPNQIFNIEWRASLLGNSPASLNFQVRLYENLARFDVIFGTAPGGGSDVTVGVQRAGAPYTEFSCHQNAIRNGTMLVFTGVADTSLFIAGRVTDSDGNPVAGVNVNLTGSSSGLVTTDGTGDYTFPGLTSGGTYSVAATQAGFSFFPPVRNFGGAGNRAFTGNFIVNFIRTAPPNPGDILISEFRFRGENVPPLTATAVNEFVEIQNNTNQGITINVTDGSLGWLVTTADPAINFIIPNGTTIPARGHYLAGNASGYSLFSYGAPDTFYDGNIPDSGGVAIFSTANPGSLDLAHRLDAAGFTGESNTLFREGAGIISPGANAGNYSFVRRTTGQYSSIVPCCKLVTGGAQDTNDNSADFQFVSTDGGNYGGVQSTLGAPGPKNTASPIQRNAQFKSALVDPVAGSTNAPNRVRNSTPNSCGGSNCALGTLTIRRRFTNNTGHGVTKLRFRIVEVTTLGNIVNANAETDNTQIFKFLDPAKTAGQADLRALDSPGGAVTITGGTVVQVRGLTVEQGSPTVTIPQPLGGGLNSSLTVGVITVAQPLAPGANVNVEFRLGVQTGGGFRFFVNIEALP